MAFCSNCGAQLEGNEHFCVKCGHDVRANGAAVPSVAASAPVEVASAPPVAPQVVAPQGFAPPPPQGLAAPPPPQGFVPPPPQGFAAPPAYPGQPPIPIIMGAPPAQSKHRGWIWAVVIIVVLYGLYYIGTHNQQKQQPQGQPVQQGQQPGGGGQPGAYPAQQQGGQGQQGGANAALAQMQSFTGQVGEANGQVQISNGQWTNRSTVAVQSVTLECIQYNANGAPLTQTQNTLNGPLQPQATTNFNPFQMGAVVQGATRAQCGIVGAIPAN